MGVGSIINTIRTDKYTQGAIVSWILIMVVAKLLWY